MSCTNAQFFFTHRHYDLIDLILAGLIITTKRSQHDYQLEQLISGPGITTTLFIHDNFVIVS